MSIAGDPTVISLVSLLLSLPGCYGGMVCLLRYRRMMKNMVTLITTDDQGEVIILNCP